MRHALTREWRRQLQRFDDDDDDNDNGDLIRRWWQQCQRPECHRITHTIAKYLTHKTYFRKSQEDFIRKSFGGCWIKSTPINYVREKNDANPPRFIFLFYCCRCCCCCNYIPFYLHTGRCTILIDFNYTRSTKLSFRKGQSHCYWYNRRNGTNFQLLFTTSLFTVHIVYLHFPWTPHTHLIGDRLNSVFQNWTNVVVFTWISRRIHNQNRRRRRPMMTEKKLRIRS